MNIMNILMTPKTRRVLILMWIFTCATCIYASQLIGYSENPYKSDIKEVTFKSFKESLEKGDVDTVYYTSKASEFYIKFKDEHEPQYGVTTNPESETFKLELLENDILVKEVSELEFGDDSDSKVSNTSVFILIVAWSLYITWAWVTCRNNSLIQENTVVTGGRGSLGAVKGDTSTSQSLQNDSKDSNVKTFDDIAGLKEVKADIKCLVDFLINKEKYVQAGAKLPKGIILYGPPGTGKTLLAKAIAGEASVPFLYMSGSDFIEMYVGVGAKRVRELFDKARKKAPCIVFIDEIDSIGGSRGHGDSNSEDRKTINALLTEMDGFKETDNIIVIGATNRIEDLDKALLRPGRFTDKFSVPLPQTNSERKEIISLYMQGKNFAEDVILDEMAHETFGFSPAQIESWINEAAIMQVQKDKSFITKEILDEAMSKILLQGHIRKDQSERDKKELETVAWHESGHAIMGKIAGNTISKVTILSSTSGAGGVTFTTPKNKGLHSIKDMEMSVMELYAGRVAELLLNNGDETLVTTGASNDIERATEIIHSMVVSYGMSKEFGLLNLEKAGTGRQYIIDKEVEIAKRLEQETIRYLKSNIENLEVLANKLLEENTVYEKDIEELAIKTD